MAPTLTYLQHHQDKMRYADDRRAGLPLTSSLMESLVKEVNQRVTGSEKFWGTPGAEAILQRRADLRRDDRPWDAFRERRQAHALGQRPDRRGA